MRNEPGLKKKKLQKKNTWTVQIEGAAALIGCLLGLNQLPAGCRVDNSGITHRCRQAEPLGTQEEEGCRPIFSVQQHRALCAHLWPVCSLVVLIRPGHRGDDSLPPFAIFHCFLFWFSPPPQPNQPPRVPLYPTAATRRASPASRPDQSKEILRRIKQGGGRRRATGYKLLHKQDLCSAAGSQCATEAFHFVVIANCNSPRHMISPDNNRGSRRGSQNLLFALK